MISMACARRWRRRYGRDLPGVPATIGLILLREPIVSMLLERWRVNAQSAEMTAWALLWFAAGSGGSFRVGNSIARILCVS